MKKGGEEEEKMGLRHSGKDADESSEGEETDEQEVNRMPERGEMRHGADDTEGSSIVYSKESYGGRSERRWG